MAERRARTRFVPALEDSELLASIVENSDDAILTKTLDGTITSWNRGAERLFGYAPGEIIGKSVLTLIPEDRHDEEPGIIARIRAGTHVDHYETVRLRKDGSRVAISLTVSPLRDDGGRIVGASKIARDITERQRAQEMQRLLMGEMQHRIKNVFALAGSLVSLSASRASTPAELSQIVRARLRALAAAHELTVPVLAEDSLEDRQLTVQGLVSALMFPVLGEEESDRFTYDGPTITMTSRAVTPLALVLNELVTNAIKHGALRDHAGRIRLVTRMEDGGLSMIWEERHPAPESPGPEAGGFGSTLSRIAVEQQLGGSITREWTDGGLTVTIQVAAENIAGSGAV